jgi:hypothetical protein
MKYIYLSLFLSLLISCAICENTSFLKKNERQKEDVPEPEPKTYNGYCFMKIKNHFYNLHPFNSIKPWKITDKKGHPIQFNFCSNIDTPCSPNDVLMAHSATQSCKKFAGKADQEKSWSLTESKTTKRTVLTVKLPLGETCAPGKQYQTSIEMTCDPKVNVPKITNDKTFDDTQCENVVKMTSKYACSSGKFSAWWNQFGMPKQALAGLLIAIGLYFIIFGVMFWKTNSSLINCAILGLILYSFLTLFFKVNLGICMICGIAIAIVAMNFPSFNGVLLGVVVGYLFGSLAYNLLVKAIPINPQALYWGMLVFFILLVSIAGGFMKSYMVCLATSLVGSYALIRGVSVYAGGYPDETYVMMLINNGEYTQFGRIFGPKIYAYIGGIFVLTAIGFWIQSYCVPKEEEKVEENKEATTEKKEENVKTTSAAETHVNEAEKKDDAK